MRRFRISFCLLPIVAVGLPAMAQSEPPASQPVYAAVSPSPVERANADAVARLYTQIAAERLDDGTPVGRVIDAVGGRDGVIEGLSRAHQIGGPREIGNGIVQVNLEIGGPRAAQLVIEAARADPDRCPVELRSLTLMLDRWAERSFVSTGNSAPDELRQIVIGAQAVTDRAAPPWTLPATPPAWVDGVISASAAAPRERSQLRTARLAEAAARTSLRNAVGALRLDEQRTLGAWADADRAVREAIDQAIDAAEVTNVDYRADGSVEIRLAVEGRRLWQALQPPEPR